MGICYNISGPMVSFIGLKLLSVAPDGSLERLAFKGVVLLGALVFLLGFLPLAKALTRKVGEWKRLREPLP
jgi:hypothetical protein